MSYCRFSSDDFQCDLYCYADVFGGYRTHVATRKYVLSTELPPPLPWSKADTKAWLAREKEVRRILDSATMVRIEKSEDGKSFTDETAPELLKRIEWLRSLGYRCPDSTFDRIREEIENPE